MRVARVRRRYEREWFYWELLIMARRCALIVVAVLAVNLASIQIVLGASVCVAAMTMVRLIGLLTFIQFHNFN
jgi:hypothetical protein